MIAITTDIIGLAFIYVRNKDNKWEEKALLRALPPHRESLHHNHPITRKMGKTNGKRIISVCLGLEGNLVFNARLLYDGVYKGVVYVHDISQLLTKTSSDDKSFVKQVGKDSGWDRWANVISYVSKIWRY